ncbi:hypothetical protein BZZ01_23535 [Nostocales cyanobacterium HT-58-2]|nr:hypothetical protein BZZ01_23535 [Nostocales cyanobacterium HT-58-2]
MDVSLLSSTIFLNFDTFITAVVVVRMIFTEQRSGVASVNKMRRWHRVPAFSDRTLMTNFLLVKSSNLGKRPN